MRRGVASLGLMRHCRMKKRTKKLGNLHSANRPYHKYNSDINILAEKSIPETVMKQGCTANLTRLTLRAKNDQGLWEAPTKRHTETGPKSFLYKHPGVENG